MQGNNSPEDKQKLSIELRNEIEITSLADGSVQVRDPVAVRYFHLGFDEAEVLKMLSYMHPLDIVQRTSYTEQELKEFLGMLKQWGLLKGTTPPPRQATKQKTVLQFMFSRFSLLDPDPILEKWVPRLRWAWSSVAQFVYVAVIILSIVGAFANGAKFAKYGWPLIAESWGITLICFVLMLFLVLLGHEFSHGLALKNFGGTVPEIGFFFIYLTPALYTDVSDVYKLKKKSEKIWVMLAGPVFQTGVGCVAFLLWEAAVTHTAIADLLYLLVVASFFSLAINLNPLIRLDGYYALQLALGVYGLRRRAWSYLKSVVMNEEPEEKITPRERKVFLLYAPLSIVYTIFIMVLIMSFYFGQSFLHFPSLTGFVALMIFLASQTPLPAQSGLENMNASEPSGAGASPGEVVNQSGSGSS
ncbi:MAG: M50 family metallopeptidase [Candidatus Caenarcaniphilales bacterium]|nr:M50 family metallopeptidase [Candidatus Caenarcaniphilales bacterium]